MYAWDCKSTSRRLHEWMNAPCINRRRPRGSGTVQLRRSRQRRCPPGNCAELDAMAPGAESPAGSARGRRGRRSRSRRRISPPSLVRCGLAMRGRSRRRRTGRTVDLGLIRRRFLPARARRHEWRRAARVLRRLGPRIYCRRARIVELRRCRSRRALRIRRRSGATRRGLPALRVGGAQPQRQRARCGAKGSQVDLHETHSAPTWWRRKTRERSNGVAVHFRARRRGLRIRQPGSTIYPGRLIGSALSQPSRPRRILPRLQARKGWLHDLQLLHLGLDTQQ